MIIHEIGNMLGLGDVRCASKLKSVMEGKCMPSEPFVARNSLYDFDQDLIMYVYGELASSNQAR